MPALPIIEKIAQDVEDCLNGVKIDEGFSIDLTARRRGRKGHTPAHGLCVIWQGAPSVDALTTGATEGFMFRRMPFALQVYLIESEKANGTIDTLINCVVADVERALMTYPQRNSGGGDAIAHNTILGDPEPFEEDEGSYTGILIPFDVQYGFKILQPDQQA